MQKTKVLLWGNGKEFHLIVGIANWKENVEIIGVVKSKRENLERVTLKEQEIPIYEPQEIVEIPYDAIVIANAAYVEVLTIADSAGIPREKIIIPYVRENAIDKYEVIMKVAEVIVNAEEVVNMLSMQHCIGGMMQQMSYDTKEYTLYNDIKSWKTQRIQVQTGDYARVRTLELIAQELREGKVKGAMAEVGVFQGWFAKIMRMLFSEKELYLYDTFEGFVEKDYENEIENGTFTEEWMQGFKNTSYNMVKNYLGTDEKNHYRKGYFPQTLEARDKEEKFCLVSLDTDMYNPTLAGLEFFYPRLVQGGYIMIHDYNVNLVRDSGVMNLSGVKKAVKDFESKHGKCCCVPITDICGTLIITK